MGEIYVIFGNGGIYKFCVNRGEYAMYIIGLLRGWTPSPLHTINEELGL